MRINTPSISAVVFVASISVFFSFRAAGAKPISCDVTPAGAQIQDEAVSSLELGKPIERELSGGQTHSYRLSLAAGEYLRVVVEQRGVNVAVAIFAPDGRQITEVDGSNDPKGSEEVLFIVDVAGVYQLKVRAVEKEKAAGRYEIGMKEQRAATAQDSSAFTDWLLRQATSLRGKGLYDAAIPLAQRSLSIQEKTLGEGHPETARSLSSLGVLYYAKRDLNRAGERLERALVLREKAMKPDDPQLVPFLNNLAVVYRDRGDYARAESLFERALMIIEKQQGPDHLDVASALERLAVVSRLRSDYIRESQLLEKALAIREKKLGSEDLLVAASLNLLAQVYVATGDYARAEALFERARTVREKQQGADHPDVAAVLNNLAIVCQYKGDYKKAEPLFQRALEIRQKRLKPEDPLIALSLNNLALLYKEKADYARALPLSLQALALREKVLGVENALAAQSLNNLAALHQEVGDLEQAEPLYQRALTIYQKTRGPEHPDVAQTLNNLAILTLLKGDYAKAEPLYQRALLIREKTLGLQHPLVAKTLDSFAVLYDLKEDIAQAVKLRNQGLEIRERHLGLILATGSEEQKRAYLTQFTLSDENNITISLHARSAPSDPQAASMALNLILQRKGRVLDAMSDSIGTLRRRLDPQGRELLEQYSAVNSRLATLTLSEQGGAGGAQYQTEVARLEAERQRLEAAISAKSAEFGLQSQPATLDRVQKLIPADAALVEIAVYQPFDQKARKVKERFGPARYVAYALKPEGPPAFVELGDAAAIDRAVADLRRALRNRKRADVKQLARKTDERVMRPIRALLGETRRVLISPDGALNLLPFAALVDERNRYLVTRYSFSYLTSGRDLLRLESRQPSRQGALIVANPAFGEAASESKPSKRQIGLSSDAQPPVAPGATQRIDFSRAYFGPLPGTAGEARRLKSILPQAVLLTREQATEAAVKQVGGPSILHIATHGFFLDDLMLGRGAGREMALGAPGAATKPAAPAEENAQSVNPLLRSGLALAGANRRQSGADDGILTALEVAGLDLQGTKLVTLSACDTGVGEVRAGEGVYGLRRALALAGSEAQVMSLWPVSDLATRDLMIEYYRALQQGRGRTEALRQVQIRMLKGISSNATDTDRLLVAKGGQSEATTARKRKRDYSHPYYWASFIQSGEWANLEGKR